MDKCWAKIRKIGKKTFIIVVAILFDLLIVLFSAITQMVLKFDFSPKYLTSDISIGLLIGGIIGGFVFSTSQWMINELKYRK
jgi:uncharacterized integral membrane protein